MEYNKLPKTYEEQADLLLSRGLQADRKNLINILQNTNYYRLSGYLYCFRNHDDSFYAGTTLDQVWRCYRFDRQLRFIILDAIERIEVGIRARIVYYFVHQYGAFGYLERKNFSNLAAKHHRNFIKKLKSEIDRSQEGFVVHFFHKYRNPLPPLWIACELFSFGQLLTFYRGIEKGLQQKIARDLQVPDVVLFSWFLALNNLRNLCAHHGRVYNRDYKIKLPSNSHKYPDWFIPFPVDGNKIFTVLTVMRYLLRYMAPQSEWHVRLNKLFNDYPDIPIDKMGFNNGWKECALWRELDRADTRRTF